MEGKLLIDLKNVNVAGRVLLEPLVVEENDAAESQAVLVEDCFCEGVEELILHWIRQKVR